MSAEIVPFIFRECKLQKEVEQEEHANPKLYIHISRARIERDTFECINGNAYHQKKRKQENDDMKNAIYPSFLECES